MERKTHNAYHFVIRASLNTESDVAAAFIADPLAVTMLAAKMQTGIWSTVMLRGFSFHCTCWQRWLFDGLLQVPHKSISPVQLLCQQGLLTHGLTCDFKTWKKWHRVFISSHLQYKMISHLTFHENNCHAATQQSEWLFSFFNLWRSEKTTAGFPLSAALQRLILLLCL